MQARRIGRELALLGMSQLPDKPEKLQRQDLEGLISSAVRTLTMEAKDALETAADELKRGSNRLVDSETLAADVDSARVMVEDAIALTQNAINRLGSALELPEFVQMTNQQEVCAFALEILTHTAKHIKTIDEMLNEVMVAWQLKRLAHIDRDILRTAVVEMQYLGTPDRVAINEAVELAKRYSGEDGYRFINGVLRRVVERDRNPEGSNPEESPEPSTVSSQPE
ncbi:MAG TPA: transcription antitermination factor NusB [Leptolyngbyaceae cyanobacterium]